MPGGGSSGSSRTVSTQELSDEQKQLFGLAMPKIEDYASSTLKMFPGSTITPFNKTQLAARDDLASTAYNTVKPLANNAIDTARSMTTAGTTGGFQGAGNLMYAGNLGSAGLGELLRDYNSGAGARDFIQSGALLSPDTNPVLGAATRAAIRPLEESLTERVLPGIASQYAGKNNMFGSSRQGVAEGKAIGDFTNAAADVATDIQMNSFNQGLGAMLSSLNSGTQAMSSGVGQGLSAGESGTSELFKTALGSLAQSPSLAELAFLPGTTLEGIGQSQQGMDQALLDEKAKRFNTSQMLPYLQGSDIIQLAMGMPGGSAVTEATQSPAYSPAQTAIGGGLMLTQLLPLLGLSDRRLKENIRHVVTDLNGIRWYTYNLAGDKKVSFGVMSDEVPHAVAGQIEGFDVVDYAKV